MLPAVVHVKDQNHVWHRIIGHSGKLVSLMMNIIDVVTYMWFLFLQDIVIGYICGMCNIDVSAGMLLVQTQEMQSVQGGFSNFPSNYPYWMCYDVYGGKFAVMVLLLGGISDFHFQLELKL